jgi:hypothetical protein
MPTKLTGSWVLHDSENFDDYMKIVGVDLATRLGAKLIKPIMIIEKNGEQWTIKSHSSFKNHEFTFTPGHEIDLTTLDGRQVKASFAFENENKLIQKEKGKIDSVITREATDENNILLTLEAGSVVSKRYYKRKA